MFCREDGTKDFITPLSVTAQALASPNPSAWVRSMGLWCNACPCSDIAPDEPHPASAARPACVVEQEADPANDAQPASGNSGAAASTNQCPPTTADPSIEEYYDAPVCSVFHGKPILPDCHEAVRSLNGYVLAHKQAEGHGLDPESDEVMEDFGVEAIFEINIVRVGDLAGLVRKWPTITFIDLPLTITEGA